MIARAVVHAHFGGEALCISVQLHPEFAGRVRADAVSKFFAVNAQRAAGNFMSALATLQPVVISFKFSDESQTVPANTDGAAQTSDDQHKAFEGDRNFIKLTWPK